MRISLKHFLRALFCLLSPACLCAEESLDYNRDVRPLLADKCWHCHGPDEHTRKAKLRLDTPEGASKVISAKDPLESELIKRIAHSDPDERMPPADSNVNKSLSPKEIAVLTEWVRQGAPFAQHWAFVKPKPPPVPSLTDGSLRMANAIDAFLCQAMARHGLAQSVEAAPEVLVRRVAFDLTGMPPTLGEVDSYLADHAKDPAAAYEKLVDHFLASPRFGERMALAWMDLARYGDSSAMHADGWRDMWPWRDWVIRAYNENMPYDQFTTEQLAGDLLPKATLAQQIASGFNRNNVTSDEGGAIPEELRVEYAVDRVKTTASTWLGLSLECAQCHDHKYDPISQKDYYQFFAYFNQAADPGMQTRQGNEAPVVKIPHSQHAERIAEVEGLIRETKTRLDARRAAAPPDFQLWVQEKEAQLKAKPLGPHPNGLTHFFPLNETQGDTVRSLGGLELKVAGKLISELHDASQGLRLDGTTSFAAATEGPELERNAPFTFIAAVKIPKGGGDGVIFSRMDEQKARRGWEFSIKGRSVSLSLVNTWPKNALRVVSKSALKEGQWEQVIVSYDGSSKASGVKIVISGSLSQNLVEKDALSAGIATMAPFRIGARATGTPLRASLDDLRIYEQVINGLEIKNYVNDPAFSIMALPVEQRSKAQIDFLFTHFLTTQDREYRDFAFSLPDFQEKLENPATKELTAMVMKDVPKMRPTYLLNRGQYDQPKKDQEVKPGIPAIFGSAASALPKNRLGLAQWLTQPDNPLTARVAVNRLWYLLFGEGLVRTLEDFGAQGEPPSNPELLDWLAVDFVSNGWNVKRAMKQLMMTAAYRQSSASSPAQREADPENRLLSRGPRFRLQGEFVRDAALSLSGLFTEKIGGPSVRTYQPDGLWEEVAIDLPLATYVRDSGEKLYRRSMYIYWKRSSPHPSMTIFDAPTREKCTVRRARTNTPLQALVALNDPQFVEAARIFGERLLKEGGTDTASRIDFGIRLALSRKATAKETQLLTRLLATQLAAFRADPAKAEQFLKTGEHPRDPSLPAPEAAAWAVLASTILNLDEFLTRG